tara:strand:- start:305 stop:472 length:168 start_codon:yes stop_codon:yes gene_type:complete
LSEESSKVFVSEDGSSLSLFKSKISSWEESFSSVFKFLLSKISFTSLFDSSFSVI